MLYKLKFQAHERSAVTDLSATYSYRDVHAWFLWLDTKFSFIVGKPFHFSIHIMKPFFSPYIHRPLSQIIFIFCTKLEGVPLPTQRLIKQYLNCTLALLSILSHTALQLEESTETKFSWSPQHKTNIIATHCRCTQNCFVSHCEDRQLSCTHS